MRRLGCFDRTGEKERTRERTLPKLGTKAKSMDPSTHHVPTSVKISSKPHWASERAPKSKIILRCAGRRDSKSETKFHSFFPGEIKARDENESRLIMPVTHI